MKQGGLEEFHELASGFASSQSNCTYISIKFVRKDLWLKGVYSLSGTQFPYLYLCCWSAFC